MWYVIVARRNKKQYFFHSIDSSGNPIWISNVRCAKGFVNPDSAKDFIRHNDIERAHIIGSTTRPAK